MRRRRAGWESLEPRLVLDATVVFNELMYHPADVAGEQLEWIELYNQMAVDIDLSKWSLAGGIDYTFAEGTFLHGGDYLVIASDPAALAAAGVAGALGPYTGQLSNGGETIELRDRNARLMDEIEYSDGGFWPVAPDGSGASLAKVNHDETSGPWQNWASSGVVGGTPGAENFATPPGPFHVGLNLSEVAPLSAPNFWIELVNTSDAAMPLAGYQVTSSAGLTYAIPAQALAPGGRLVLNEAQLGFQSADGEAIFLVGPGGGEVVDALRIHEAAQARRDLVSSEWLTPASLTPGDENDFTFVDDIVINEIMYHAAPQLSAPARPGEFGPPTTIMPLDAIWRYDDNGDAPEAGWNQSDPPFDDSAWKSGPGMFYVETATLGGLPKSTPLTHGHTAYYFRTTFNLTDPNAQSILLEHVIDDGATFYINGHRFYSFNLDVPDAELNSETPATGSVADAVVSAPQLIPAEFLVAGENVLAVEAHQITATSSDIVMGARLLSAELVTPPQPAQPFAESDEEWVELFNRGDETIDLSGWSFVDAFDYEFPVGVTIAPGEYLTVARDPVALAAKFPGAAIVGGFTGTLSNTDERIALRDSHGNPADEVHYFEDGRWPEYADGGGVSLELRDPWADNSIPESWAISDETSRTEWRTYSYTGTTLQSAVGPDGQWHEFVMGLLDSGEILLDDLQVIENPSTAPRQLIQNGTFSDGTTDKWRIIGNHDQSEIINDPDDPTNKVLRLVADGETDHMSNHAETTLKFGNSFVQIANNREYQISFRARWVAGSPQLNTRLYFNRLPRTTNIDRPDAAGTPGAPNSRLEANIGPTFSHFIHGPVVPAANAPVTVSAAADDPQGVASMTLWYAVGDGAWTSGPMTLGTDGKYRAQIPGQSAGRIVQFYVEAVDNAGATSTFPAAGRDSRALYKVQDNLAATNGLHNLRLIVTPSDTTALHQTVNLMSNAWTGGTVIYDESQVFYDVGIRLKGSEHSRTTPERLGFTVRFNADQRFRGVYEAVSIDRSESTGFGQREMLIHATLNHAGDLPTKYSDLIKVISPQATHTSTAELQLARYGNDFLDTQYENGSDGEIFEYELVYQLNSTNNGTPEGLKVPAPDSVVGTPIRDMGTDDENYRWTFLLKNNRAEDDYSGIMNFAKVFSTSGGRDPETTVDQIIDVDQWLRAYAVSMLSGAGDNYGGDGSQHNVMFYQRPSDGKFLQMPHDVDAFYDANRPLIPSSDLQKLLSTPARNRAYYGHVQDIISTTYNSSYMSHWSTHFGQLLPGQPFASHLSFIVQRSTSILNQVKGRVPEIPFSITTADGAQTAGPTITIGGNGWVNVREIRVAGSDAPLTLTWTDLDSWTAAIPVQFGEQTVSLEAYDFRGNLIASDQVIVESTFTDRPLEAFLRISEINYHPADPVPGSPFEDANFEFIELVNTGPETLDLSAARFTEGIQFDFNTAAIKALAPGERLIVIQDQAGFENRYGLGLPVAGVFTGRLDNSGERIRLENNVGATILDFTYDDGWHPETDGSGYTLTIVDATGPTEAWGTAEGWRPSRGIHGSPGAGDDGILGDTNDDGQVNLDDLNNVRNFFGGGAEGDADGDGDTDLDDLNAVRNNFGQGGAPANSTLASPVTEVTPTKARLDQHRTAALDAVFGSWLETVTPTAFRKRNGKA